MIKKLLDLSAPDVWTRLAGERRPILLYGMGNGADKILSVLKTRGISVSGVFASDGFAREKLFHGMRVISTTEMRRTYPPHSAVILLAFGTSRPEVLSLIDALAADYTLLVPDVPVCGNTLFDAAFAAANKEALLEARALFEDDSSRALFDEIIRAKLTGEPSAIKAAVSEPYDLPQLLCPHALHTMADLGAYNGDTVREMLAAGAPLSFVLAAEPDARNFKKLRAFADTLHEGTVECHQCAVGSTDGTAVLDASGNRNAGLFTGDMISIHGEAARQREVPLCRLDTLLAGRAVELVKLDVEGAEAEALLGAANTLAAHAPVLRVAAYHRAEDLFALPLLIKRLNPSYRLLLRRRAGFPLWDIDVVALPAR